MSHEEQERDDLDAGEVGTAFATKGSGWSGRDDDEERDPSARAGPM